MTREQGLAAEQQQLRFSPALSVAASIFRSG